jgi:hypothetical protein
MNVVRRRPLLLAAIAIGLLSIGGLVAWPRNGDETSNAELADASRVQYPPILPGLCEARIYAERVNRTRAYDAFYSQSHQGLHVLAADLEWRKNRDLAAQLLRSKSRVENDLLQQNGPLVPSLDALIETARAALRSVDADVSTVDCGSQQIRTGSSRVRKILPVPIPTQP